MVKLFVNAMTTELKDKPGRQLAPEMNQALVALCSSALPVLARQLATCRTQSEAATSELLSALAEMGKHVHVATPPSPPITAAQARDENDITLLAKACEDELGPLLGELDPHAVTAIRRVLGMIRQSGDKLVPVSPPMTLDANRLNSQLQRMNTGFQSLERISQMMTVLQEDLGRLQALIVKPGSDPQALAQRTWRAESRSLSKQ